MNLVEVGAIGGLASPLVVALGLGAQAWMYSRGAAAKEAQRAEAARSTEKSLAKGLQDLADDLKTAIAEFKVSNDRNAKHELDCAQFRAETVTTLKATATALEKLGNSGERIAKVEQRLDTVEGKIDYGTQQFEAIGRRFEGVNRALSTRAFGKEGGAFQIVEDGPAHPARPKRPRA